MTALSRAETPGPESSIGKLIAANQLQDLAGRAIEPEGQYGILTDPSLAPMQAAFQQAYMDPGPAHRGRNGRDPEEHHRRAGAEPARRHPRR